MKYVGTERELGTRDVEGTTLRLALVPRGTIPRMILTTLLVITV